MEEIWDYLGYISPVRPSNRADNSWALPRIRWSNDLSARLAKFHLKAAIQIESTRQTRPCGFRWDTCANQWFPEPGKQIDRSFRWELNRLLGDRIASRQSDEPA